MIERLPSLPTFESTSSSLDLDVDNIPPPPTHCDMVEKQPVSLDSSSSTTSPPPPPPMLLDGSDQGPPTAVYTDNAGFPFPPRTLSRISEGSSKPDAPMCSRSG